MNKYPDFWSVVIGPGPLGAFLGFLVIALMAAAVRILIKASDRDITSNNTPVLFSWKFFFAHNLSRMLANFLAIPLLIRVSYQLVPDGLLMLLTAIGIGIGADYAAALLQKIGVLSNNKFASRVLDKVKPEDPVVIAKDSPN